MKSSIVALRTNRSIIKHVRVGVVCWVSGSQVSCFNRVIPPNQFLFHASLQDFNSCKCSVVASLPAWTFFFLLALAEQHNLTLTSASGSWSPSMGERSQHCLADKGNSTWFHPRSKAASRTVPPCKAACGSYSPAWQWGSVITCIKTGRCLKSLWNINSHKFHSVDTVVWLLSPSCRGEVIWSVLSEITLVDTGGTIDYFLFSIPPISPSISLFPPTPSEDEWKRWSSCSSMWTSVRQQ